MRYVFALMLLVPIILLGVLLEYVGRQMADLFGGYPLAWSGLMGFTISFTVSYYAWEAYTKAESTWKTKQVLSC